MEFGRDNLWLECTFYDEPDIEDLQKQLFQKYFPCGSCQ